MLLISLQVCLLAYLLVPGLTCSEDIGSQGGLKRLNSAVLSIYLQAKQVCDGNLWGRGVDPWEKTLLTAPDRVPKQLSWLQLRLSLMEADCEGRETTSQCPARLSWIKPAKGGWGIWTALLYTVPTPTRGWIYAQLHTEWNSKSSGLNRRHISLLCRRPAWGVKNSSGISTVSPEFSCFFSAILSTYLSSSRSLHSPKGPLELQPS